MAQRPLGGSGPGLTAVPLTSSIRVVRAVDLLDITFSFRGLGLRAGATGTPPVLSRTSDGDGVLILTLPTQHRMEHAVFEPAAGLPVGPSDPDAGNDNTGFVDPLRLPVASFAAGETRLAFTVDDQPIPFTLAGLLDACRRLDLRVAPVALPPDPPPGLPPIPLPAGGGPPAVTGGTLGGVVAAARARAATIWLTTFYGAELAAEAVASLAGAAMLGRPVPGPVGGSPPTPVLTGPPGGDQSAIELPTRLVISPNAHAAWAHATDVEEQPPPGTPTELWHTRLGTRTVGGGIDERTPTLRTVRAVWARDFDVDLMGSHFPFAGNGAAQTLPPADGTDDFPWLIGSPSPTGIHSDGRLPIRSPLTASDRYKLVHQTADFGLSGYRPPAVPAGRLMLSTLGGWLDVNVAFPGQPAGTGFDIETWRQRATLGRDHEVRVVYAGFLFPLGHRASLVKVTERRFDPDVTGNPALCVERMFIVVRDSVRAYGGSGLTDGSGRSVDRMWPLVSVEIGVRVTPLLDDPTATPDHLLTDPGSFCFVPRVNGRPFAFPLATVDVSGNAVALRTPLVFVSEADNVASRLSELTTNYVASTPREAAAGGQGIAYAPADNADDTTLPTDSLRLGAVPVTVSGGDQAVAQFHPTVTDATTRVPTAIRLTGRSDTVTVSYGDAYAIHGFDGQANTGQVFLHADGLLDMDFANHAERAGALVTPTFRVTGLSRATGPIGGDPEAAAGGGFDPKAFFASNAQLFGVISLGDIIDGLPGFVPGAVPTFSAAAVPQPAALLRDLDALGVGDQVAADARTLVAGGSAPDLVAHLEQARATLQAAPAAVGPVARIARAGPLERVGPALADPAATAQALSALAAGQQLPTVGDSGLTWKPRLKKTAIFQPTHPEDCLTVSVEQTGEGADVSATMDDFTVDLVAPHSFLTLHVERLSFTSKSGEEPDVKVLFADNGIQFVGVLAFVDTLKDLIPLDGFSDPPELDTDHNGVNLSYSLALPDLAVGVFSLDNLSLSAAVRIPFIGEAVQARFSFCTRDNPFRLSVAMFAGGGFFGLAVTPAGVDLLEAAFEFGADLSVDFGVASGGVSVMAGIYYRMERNDAALTGYFRMRGDVNVLGLISASIELYLSLAYEFASGKCVGRATITIEVDIIFFSISVSISCEKRFKGARGDPTFVELMAGPPGARPWDDYCEAFAEVP